MNPWSRLPKESPEAFAAFICYRDLGIAERSTARVAQECRKTKGLMDRWSRTHGWVSRAAAWDSHLDRVAQQATEKARGEMAERQVRLGRALQGRAAQGLSSIKPEKLKATEVAALAKAGVDIERVAAGEPTAIQENRISEESRAKLRGIFDEPEPSP